MSEDESEFLKEIREGVKFALENGGAGFYGKEVEFLLDSHDSLTAKLTEAVEREYLAIGEYSESHETSIKLQRENKSLNAELAEAKEDLSVVEGASITEIKLSEMDNDRLTGELKDAKNQIGLLTDINSNQLEKNEIHKGAVRILNTKLKEKRFQSNEGWRLKEIGDKAYLEKVKENASLKSQVKELEGDIKTASMMANCFMDSESKLIGKNGIQELKLQTALKALGFYAFSDGDEGHTASEAIEEIEAMDEI